MTKTLRVALGLLLCLLLCVCLLPAAYADSTGAETFAALKQAIANGDTYFNMIDCDTVVFTEDITIPSTMHLEAYGTSVIIPEGVTLTVDGTAQFSHVTVQSGGHVTVNKYFGAYSMLAYESVDQFTVNGEFEVFEASWTDDLRNLRLGENADFELGISVKSKSALATALAKDYHFPSKQFTKNISIHFPWVLDQDYDIRDVHIDIDSDGSLTIPEGKTLTISDVLRAQGRPIYLQGTMINNGRFSIHKKNSTGALLIRSGNGSYSGGDIRVYADADECDSCLEGFEKILSKKSVEDWGTVYAVSDNLFWALKNAIANGESDFYMRNCGTVHFAESITIPNTTKVHGSGTEIVIPNGVTLTVENYCSVGTLTVQPGGHVTVSNVDGAHLNVRDALSYSNVNQFTVNRYMEIKDRLWRDNLKNLSFGTKGALAVVSNVTSDEELEAALAIKPSFPSKSFQRNIYIEYDWELYDDLDIQGFSIYVDEPDSSLTIKRSAALTIHNRLRVKDGHLQIKGAVINHGEFLVQRDERLEGALVTMTETGNFVGTKPIAVFGDNPDSCLEGFDLSLFDKELVPGGGGMDVTIYTLTEQPLFTELKAAIASGETNFNMNNRGTLLITEDVTIPANMRLTANENCAVVVAGGATLTVDGKCGIRLFDVLDGGHVTVSEGAYFGVSNVLTYVRVDQFTVNGSFEVFEPAWTDELKNLSLGEKADFELGITAKNEDALIAALARDYHFPNKKFTKNVTVLFDWILSQDYTISDVHIDIGFDGSLTIPEGKTLINSDTLRAQDGPIYLQGTLINYGQFFVHPDKSTGALLIRSGNGYYGGRELVVHADMGKRDACLSGFDLSKFDTYVGAWGTSYFPPKDLVLPGSLQTLEAEAFTGGSFRSVLIPPSIRSIAPTAFGDMTGLVIYGSSGTAAEQFAAGHGHYFVNMQ